MSLSKRASQAMWNGFFDEMEKIAGSVPAALSMGGLAGLTAIEGSGALNKKHSDKERLKDGASAAFTGSILAGEAIHNKDMLKGVGEKAIGFGKRLLTKKGSVEKTAGALKKIRNAALVAGGVGAVGAGYTAKKVADEFSQKEAAPMSMMQMHRLADAAKAARPAASAATGTIRPASAAAHAGYADFMPAGRFSGAGQGLPQRAQTAKAIPAGPVARTAKGIPAKPNSAAVGVMGRIGKLFRGA